jgi:ferredoxin-NADP reductase
VERDLQTARLTEKVLLSASAQCFHLRFAVEGMECFNHLPGQFISAVSRDSHSKLQTRAYTIASAPQGGNFDLCVNRVPGGHFSNLLAEMEIGGRLQFRGPMGDFTLAQPLTDTLLVATGTGVAPMRAFVQQLFPSAQEDRSQGRHIWLLYGTRYETEIYYRDLFEKTAAEHPNFHYLVTLSRAPEGWQGLRGHVQEHVRALLQPQPEQRPLTKVRPLPTQAYLCGLNKMVSANRALLRELGWERKQVHSERYD